MGKQTKPKKSENFGKGQVTPVQVAFIVDRYLADNNYLQTRSMFRTEASTLVPRSPGRESLNGLLSLGAMLDEYISLKEQKVLLDQDKVRLEQEKSRIHMLLHGMQGVMNDYNSGAAAIVPPLPAAATVAGVPQLDRHSGSSTGCRVYSTPSSMYVPVPSHGNMEPASFYTPMLNQISTSKRKDTNVTKNQQARKKTRTKPPTGEFPVKGTNNPSEPNGAAESQNDDPHCSLVKSSPSIDGTGCSSVQASNVAKCLFDKHSSNSPSPRTPPRQVSSQSDKTHCTVISSERLTVSPDKRVTYTVERSHTVMTSPGNGNPKRSSSSRDHVKGRLDFDGSDKLCSDDKQIVDRASTSETRNDFDLFDADLPNLDIFGADFSFSELLVDLDLGGDGIGFSCEPTLSTDDVSGSSHESGECNPGTEQVMSEFSSSMKVMSEENNLRGPETTTTVKAITKCIRIVSPAKSR